MDEKQRAELDQAQAFLAEYLPPTWRNLYEGCKREGFSELESLGLLKTYILSQAANGVNGV